MTQIALPAVKMPRGEMALMLEDIHRVEPVHCYFEQEHPPYRIDNSIPPWTPKPYQTSYMTLLREYQRYWDVLSRKMGAAWSRPFRTGKSEAAFRFYRESDVLLMNSVEKKQLERRLHTLRGELQILRHRRRIAESEIAEVMDSIAVVRRAIHAVELRERGASQLDNP
ncbi:hypothetical protein HDIA_0753 [Hartmannibacter diazotrophicus]|uniref:Uncharacterized protein n=2 Tax=Hartmannibacter diazotrophicus TaxID=1482074 RepID=A0A2C9D231_9HYPH|nr:hypothetical protein HDIA_0753 [Hartmannibacter diazotrophicus]